jgi:hypothetical protein
MNIKQYNSIVPTPSAPIEAVAYAVPSSHVYVANAQGNQNQSNSYPNPQQSIQNNFNMQEFTAFVREYEISNEYAIKLRQLEGYDIVFICDDSGSMKTKVTTPNTKKFDEVMTTRWDEMKNIVSVVTKLGIILDDDGVDLYFLNREPVFGVTSQEQIDVMFAVPPSGYTPILKTLKQVIKDKAHALAEKKLLIIIATDGEPTDENGKNEDSRGVQETQKLYDFLDTGRNPKNKIHTTILACTDDDAIMEYLENWDSTLMNFDLVDDYYSERNRIQEAQGKGYRFSFGDYVVKILLGSIDKTLDSLDGSSAAKPTKTVNTTNTTNQNYPSSATQPYQQNQYSNTRQRQKQSVCTIC